ncbi:DNA methylase [Pedobacter terrae]|uniref:DNA methylase n=1 Tax=Pedobacter terrae TaxID=405671 RepID=A0A1G8D7Y6_9SPHI|nr:DNA methyltransferase [Pedobacter terrae]SDH53867.1 DNA methylase [Pedobacter terrae]
MAWENDSRLDTLEGLDTEVVMPSNNSLRERIYVPVKALSHTSPYKIHKYFARRPWNVFNLLIDTYSDENEIILDPFCGGGVTIYEGLAKGRRPIGFDLNPLSIFVVGNMVKQIDDEIEFANIFHQIAEYLDKLYGSHQGFEIEGKKFRNEWYELAFKVVCNHCNELVLLSNENKITNGVYKCSNPGCDSHITKKGGFEAKNCKRVSQDYLLRVAYSEDGTKDVTKVDELETANINSHISELKQLAKKQKVKVSADEIPRNWDRQFEDQLFQKGIRTFQDFFTERNLLLLSLLLSKINSYKGILSTNDFELLRLCFSNTLKDTSIMSFTNSQWQSGRPAAWSKHAYWVPSQFCEVSVSKAFKASLNRVKAAVEFNKERALKGEKALDYNSLIVGAGNMLLMNTSLDKGGLPAESVSAIITDPPYGSNVQYLELSHFWYPWNQDLYAGMPNFSAEAISNRKKNFEGAKSMYTYEENLMPVFKECFRVLKNGRHMVLTFNNKDVSAWLALLFSIFRAGFTMERSGLFFQDGVQNYKQTAHTRFQGSPYGDFIYSFIKAKPEHPLKEYSTELEFRQELDEKFKHWMAGELNNKNTTILEMFLDVIPLIEGFSKSYLKCQNHSLYDFFKKDYFKTLF